MNLFFSAIELADSMGVAVCDCYSKWLMLSQPEDTTLLLVNRINHPISQMHKLFADALYGMIIGEDQRVLERDGGIYKGLYSENAKSKHQPFRLVF